MTAFYRLRFAMSILFLFRILPGTWAQEAWPMPRFQTIGVNEGLSQSTVPALYQDRQGFMWIGTGDGLNRFDGTTLRVFRVPAPKGTLPASFVRGNLCEDKDGNIWFANENGLHCWDAQQQKLTTRLAAGRGQWPAWFSILLIRDQVLWAYHCESGFLRYDLRTSKTSVYAIPDRLQETGRPYCFDAQADSLGRIWFKRSQQGRIYCFDSRTAVFSLGFPPSRYQTVHVAKGAHYLLAQDGFMVYDSSSRRSRHIKLPLQGQDPNPVRLTTDRWGRAWIATQASGLFCYSPATQSLRRYHHNKAQAGSLPIDLTTVLYIDRADNLWVGTDGAGVCRLDLKPPRFRAFPLNKGDYPLLKDYFIKSFYEDKAGRIWFGTHSDGFGILDRSAGKLAHYKDYGPEHKPLKVVGAIEKAPDGNIWLAHALAFTSFNPVTRRFEDIPVTPAPQVHTSVSYGTALINLQGNRVLGATSKGLVLFTRKNGRWQGHRFEGHPQLGCFSTAVCQLADGSIWAAFNSLGLLRLQLAGDSLRVTGQFLKGLQVRGLHPDEQEPRILWAGTSNGFVRLDTHTGQCDFKGEEDGMTNAYVYGLLEDQQHNLWLSTNGGLICYERGKGKFTSYTYADGLQSNEFNSGAFYKGPGGNLYFGGIHGFNWLEPGWEPAAAQQPPPVALSDFAINGQRMALVPGRALSLPHHRNDMAFRIAVLDYSRPEANKVAYFLEGWDQQWIESRNHEAHYANLPPGRYTLHIRGCNASGVWSRQLVFPITIKAPFYRTPLFYAGTACAVLVLLVLSVFFLVRSRLRAQRRIIAQQQLLLEERTRISKDMHDEIGSGLTRIAMMSESLGLQQVQPEATKKKIAAAARNLVQSMSEIIWALNPEHDSLEGLLAYLREQLHLFIEPFGIAYDIDFPEAVPGLELSNAQRRNIYLTAKEAVNNALKHARPTAISIVAKADGNALHFEIRDNGCGFNPAAVRRSANGLRNMGRRMQELGGYFHCDSQPQGTTISFGLIMGAGKMIKSSRQPTTFFTSAGKKQQNIFDE